MESSTENPKDKTKVNVVVDINDKGKTDDSVEIKGKSRAKANDNVKLDHKGKTNHGVDKNDKETLTDTQDGKGTVGTKNTNKASTSNGHASATSNPPDSSKLNQKAPPTEWARETYHYIMGWRRGESGDAFEKFPHMENILENPEQVPQYLRDLWDKMDEVQKREYRGLDDLVQNIGSFTTVSGAAKDELLHFIILMSLFGDKDAEHPVKILYFAEDNGRDTEEFPKQLNQMLKDFGKRTTATLRLYDYEQSPDLVEDPLQELDALDTSFIIQHQLAAWGCFSGGSAQALLEKTKEGSLELHAAVYQHYLDHREEHLSLQRAVGNFLANKTQKGEARAELRQLVFKLYAEFLDKFSGVIVSRLLPGVAPAFAGHFKPDICLVDKHVTARHLISVIRHHNPALVITIGDHRQIVPFARLVDYFQEGETAATPSQDGMGASPMSRADPWDDEIEAFLKLALSKKA